MKPAAQPVAYRRPDAPVDALRLDANEGPRPAYLETAGLPDLEALRRYPDASALEEDLAARFGLDPAQVLVTAGGDDAIDRLCRRCLAGGRALALTEPTFVMFARHARLAGGAVRSVPWWDGPYPVAAVARLVDADTGLLAVVSPNNPTGAVIGADQLRMLRRLTGETPLLLDAAYAEYADGDLTAAALALPRTLVLRTFSKAWGLAGLRVGYLLGPADLVAELRAWGPPYAVAGASLALARAALATGGPAVASGVAAARAARADLEARLRRLGAAPLPSQGNFVLCRPRDAAFAGAALGALGVSARTWPGDALLDGCLRVTCPATRDEADRLARALATALAPEALLLDLDGVVADEGPSYRACITGVLAAHGFTVTRQAVAAAKARGGANDDWALTRRLLAERGVDLPLDRVIAEFQDLYRGAWGRPGLAERETLIPDRALLARLAARLPLGIVTGRPRAEAEAFLARTGIADLFATLVAREDAPAKPDPAPVREALRRLGVARAWLVGDTPDDVNAARAAGVVPLGVRPPDAADDTGAALAAAGAARILDSLADLEELLP